MAFKIATTVETQQSPPRHLAIAPVLERRLRPVAWESATGGRRKRAGPRLEKVERGIRRCKPRATGSPAAQDADCHCGRTELNNWGHRPLGSIRPFPPNSTAPDPG